MRSTRMGYRRVGTVTEVAEFSVRGGILDVYGFGMAVPARLEWWGDDISSIRGFDLTTQRSLETLEEITVLPVSTGGVGEEAPVVQVQGRGGPGAQERRTTLLDLLPPDTLVIEEAAGPDADEVTRAWKEAEHHLEVARRLGEDVPSRSAILAEPEVWRAALARFPRLLLAGRAAGDPVRLLPAGEGRPGSQPSARAARRLAAHHRAVRQRGPARAAGGAAGRGRGGSARRSQSARSTAAS